MSVFIGFLYAILGFIPAILIFWFAQYIQSANLVALSITFYFTYILFGIFIIAVMEE